MNRRRGVGDTEAVDPIPTLTLPLKGRELFWVPIQLHASRFTPFTLHAALT